MKILFSPLISEKSLDQTDQRRYTFKIDRTVNKSELKKILEKTYKVTVEKINIINQLGKRKRVKKAKQASQRWGKRSDFKKAIVRIKKGQKIKDFEVEQEKNKNKNEGTKS